MTEAKFIREVDDPLGLRISIGGNPRVGRYFTFRGDPAKVVELLEGIVVEAREALLSGDYEDTRKVEKPGDRDILLGLVLAVGQELHLVHGHEQVTFCGIPASQWRARMRGLVSAGQARTSNGVCDECKGGLP